LTADKAAHNTHDIRHVDAFATYSRIATSTVVRRLIATTICEVLEPLLDDDGYGVRGPLVEVIATRGERR
jgi:hypothetical protein